MCDCKSYNGDFGAVPEVVLPRPEWMPEGQRLNGVPVDACIADVIQHLWASGIVTLGCCCGHNGKCGAPSIVLDDGVTDFVRTRELIAEVDDRRFDLKQWQLVDV